MNTHALLERLPSEPRMRSNIIPADSSDQWPERRGDKSRLLFYRSVSKEFAQFRCLFIFIYSVNDTNQIDTENDPEDMTNKP